GRRPARAPTGAPQQLTARWSAAAPRLHRVARPVSARYPEKTDTAGKDRTMKMRRSILAIGAIGAALTLAACAGTTDDGGSTEGGGETLTLWVDPNRYVEMQPLVDAYEEQSGVKIELVEKAVEDIGPDFVAQVPTGEGPDMIISAHDGLGEWVKNGVVAPIEFGDKVDSFLPVAS